MFWDLNVEVVGKLLISALLGGLVGLEREMQNKPAGLRTNMFICMGSTLFTLLSEELANRFGGDQVRIVAQLIPGIGFIGAGAIIREGASVVGLTTASTIFIVASVGMAVGGGLYATAVFATILILFILTLIGWVEKRYKSKG